MFGCAFSRPFHSNWDPFDILKGVQWLGEPNRLTEQIRCGTSNYEIGNRHPAPEYQSTMSMEYVLLDGLCAPQGSGERLERVVWEHVQGARSDHDFE